MKPIIGIFPISGFTETEMDACGQDKIQRRLDQKFHHDQDVEVYDLRPWKADMAGLAELARRDGITHAIVLGYSHGAGYGSPHLCRELAARKIHVPLVLLCDPVYRPQWLPRWTIAQILSFRALIPRSATISFPGTVGRIRGVRQANNVPQGHRIRIGKGEPFDVWLLTRPDVTHADIDDSEEWAELVDTEVEKTIGVLRALA